MKVDELKLGDIVKCNEKVVKITALGHTGVCVADIKDKFKKDWTDSCYLTPTPITEEILKKNGWKKHLRQNNLYKNGYMGIAIQKDNTFDFLYLETHIHTISYVHQLQHILWSFGVDDNLKF